MKSGQVGEEELILWRDIAWERRTYKASIEEGFYSQRSRSWTSS